VTGVVTVSQFIAASNSRQPPKRESQPQDRGTLGASNSTKPPTTKPASRTTAPARAGDADDRPEALQQPFPLREREQAGCWGWAGGEPAEQACQPVDSRTVDKQQPATQPVDKQHLHTPATRNTKQPSG